MWSSVQWDKGETSITQMSENTPLRRFYGHECMASYVAIDPPGGGSAWVGGQGNGGGGWEGENGDKQAKKKKKKDILP